MRLEIIEKQYEEGVVDRNLRFETGGVSARYNLASEDPKKIDLLSKGITNLTKCNNVNSEDIVRVVKRSGLGEKITNEFSKSSTWEKNKAQLRMIASAGIVAYLGLTDTDPNYSNVETGLYLVNGINILVDLWRYFNINKAQKYLSKQLIDE